MWKRIVPICAVVALIIAFAWHALSAAAFHRLSIRLLVAVESNDRQSVRALLGQGANPNAARDDDCPWWWGLFPGLGRQRRISVTTALGTACEKGDIGIVELLLTRGANPNVQSFQTAPLWTAVSHGDTQMVTALLRSGANPSWKDDTLGTVLECACTYDPMKKPDRVRIVQTLLDAGADVNAADESGSTALIGAACNGHTEIVKMLLARGPKVNVRESGYGFTPIGTAAGNGHSEVVKLLLAHGARVDVRDRDGQTALQLATSNRDWKIVRILRHAGAKE